jgi:ribosomal protein S25
MQSITIKTLERIFEIFVTEKDKALSKSYISQKYKIHFSAVDYGVNYLANQGRIMQIRNGDNKILYTMGNKHAKEKQLIQDTTE